MVVDYLYYGGRCGLSIGYTMVLQCTMLSADFGLDAVRIKLRDNVAAGQMGNQ